MAVLVNNSSGNFTTAGTWSLINPTNFQPLFATQETGVNASAVTFTSNVAFTPGAITVDGIGLKISSRSASPTGTMSVRLAITGVPVVGTTVTVNVSDLPVIGPTWTFFKFTIPITLLGATAYTVQVQSSTAGQVTLNRQSATASDWTFFLRTTTNQAPAATDQLITCGDFISAGVNNTYTVTMDNTSSTSFGPATTGAIGLEIATKSIVKYATSVSTNYLLRIAGHIFLTENSSLIIGDSVTPMPASSTATLEVIVTSNVQFQIAVRTGTNGTFTTFGATKTGRAYLAADASASATSITTDISTGWLNGDNVALASTTRTIAESENKTLTANASGTTVSISALTSAHSGTNPIRAELINLTRNVKVSGQSTTLQTSMQFTSNAIINLNYTEFFFMGSGTANLRGLDIQITVGSCSITGCSFRNFEVSGSMSINVPSTITNTTVSDCVFYRIANNAINTAGNVTLSPSFTNCWAITNLTAAQPIIQIGSVGGTFNGLVAVSSTSNGIAFAASDCSGLTVNNITAHSNAVAGIVITNNSTSTTPVTFSNLITWRNNTRGLFLSSSSNFIINTLSSFGNVTNGLELSSCFSGRVISPTLNAGTILLQPIGVGLVASNAGIYIDNGSFGATTTHATGDFQVTSNRSYNDVIFRNCLFNSTTEASVQTNLLPNIGIGSSRHDQTVGSHRMWKKFGTITSDTTFFVTQAPSQRLTPNNATNKLTTQEKKVAVPSGKAVKISVYIRKSVVGDGTAYNGAQPRLLLVADPAAGIASDTVIATATNVANGAFEYNFGTTTTVTDDTVLKFYIDCDGTTGWVNIDRWAVEVI
jgi:hypothetical protein